jgi:hypothetical protein
VTLTAFISRQLWRVNQGLARISIFWNIIGFLTFVKVWQSTFEYYGLGILGVFAVLGIAYFLTSWTIGYFNEVKNFSREEWKHQIGVQNPEYWQLIDDAAACRAILERVK